MLDSREFKKKCILKKSLLQIYSTTIILTIILTQSEKLGNKSVLIDEKNYNDLAIYC